MENRKNQLILIVLGLALFVQVFNAASLYHTFSNLNNIMKFVGSAFIGLSAEIGIFTCVYAGSQTAGKYFAVLSFFVGILFHATFTELEQINFWTSKNFIASTLMQIINSSLVWYLSELYVERTELDKTKTDYKNLQQKLSQLKIQVKEMEHKRSDLDQTLEDLEIKRSDAHQEVIKLKRSKAGLSH